MNVVTDRQVGGERVPAVAPVLTRVCARPGCSAPAAATLAFFYRAREVCLERLELDEMPSTYNLCAMHADRTRPPYGWVLTDRRAVPKPTEAAPDSESQDASRTVADAPQSASDRSRPFRWLGVAVETTVAFYPPNSEAFEDLPTVEPSGEARLVDPDSGVRVVESSDEAGLVDPDSGVRIVESSDEARLVDPDPSEALPEEEFVPVRARTW